MKSQSYIWIFSFEQSKPPIHFFVNNCIDVSGREKNGTALKKKSQNAHSVFHAPLGEKFLSYQVIILHGFQKAKMELRTHTIRTARLQVKAESYASPRDFVANFAT